MTPRLLILSTLGLGIVRVENFWLLGTFWDWDGIIQGGPWWVPIGGLL